MCPHIVFGTDDGTRKFDFVSGTGFLCRKSLWYGPVESYFAVYDRVVLTGPSCRNACRCWQPCTPCRRRRGASSSSSGRPWYHSCTGTRQPPPARRLHWMARRPPPPPSSIDRETAAQDRGGRGTYRSVPHDYNTLIFLYLSIHEIIPCPQSWPCYTAWVSGRTETKIYGSAADTLTFQTLTGRKPLW
jgi:hypothetical protein